MLIFFFWLGKGNFRFFGGWEGRGGKDFGCRIGQFFTFKGPGVTISWSAGLDLRVQGSCLVLNKNLMA